MIWLKLLVLLVVVTWQVECRPNEFGPEASATTPKIFGVGLNPMSTVAQILRDMDLNVLFDSGIIVPSYDPWDAVVSKLDGISFDDWEGAVSIGGLRYLFPPILKAYPTARFITLWREPSDWLNAIVGFQVSLSESDRYVWVDFYNRYYNTLVEQIPQDQLLVLHFDNHRQMLANPGARNGTCNDCGCCDDCMGLCTCLKCLNQTGMECICIQPQLQFNSIDDPIQTIRKFIGLSPNSQTIEPNLSLKKEESRLDVSEIIRSKIESEELASKSKREREAHGRADLYAAFIRHGLVPDPDSEQNQAQVRSINSFCLYINVIIALVCRLRVKNWLELTLLVRWEWLKKNCVSEQTLTLKT
jgi:hypothetical protein